MRAHAVDRQLERALFAGRAAGLVIHDPERPVLQQIDAIGLGAERDAPRLTLGRERERVFELVLEQPLHDRDAVLDFEREGPLAESGGGRRPEKERALQGAIPFRELREALLGDGVEQRHGFGDVGGRDRAVADPLPLGEEALEHLVHEVAALLRRHPGLFVPFLGQLEDVRREVFERALQVPLQAADGVRGRRARAGVAAKPRVLEAAARPQRQPFGRRSAEDAGHDRIDRQRLVREHARLTPGARDADQSFDRETGRLDVFEQGRGGDNRVVLERERRERDTPARKAQEILELRARGGEAVLVPRPSERGQEGLRVENAARAALRPVRFGQADDPHLVEVRVGRRAGVEQHDPRAPQARRERLPFDPPPHRTRQLRDRQGRGIVRRVRVPEHLQRRQYRRARAKMPRPPRIGGGRASLAGCNEAEDPVYLSG